jgi:hypothetical protein
MPLSPAGPLVALARKKEIKNPERDSRLIYDLEAELAAADFLLFNQNQTKQNKTCLRRFLSWFDFDSVSFWLQGQSD